MTKEVEKYILILGGNGFIGAECVEYLLDEHIDSYKLILVNRGNWDDWDTLVRIKQRGIHANIIFDRSEDDPSVLRSALSSCLPQYETDSTFRFEAIVDFSGFKSKQIDSVCQAIRPEAIRRYIYISTDSVYEVSIPSKNKGGPLVESDSVRPESSDEIERLKKLDDYAHHKLKCEEKLTKLSSQKKFPYVFLRLPDVLGKRDSSHRFWELQMQLEYLEFVQPGQTHRIEISRPFYELKTSYVNVKDIARVIPKLIESENVLNEAFNIGFDNSITLIEFYKLLAKQIKPGLENRLEFVPTDEKIFHPFPSVTRGPISIEKLKKTIGYEPISDMANLFQDCVEFYRKAYTRFPKMRRQAEKEAKRDLNIKSTEDKEKFEKFINNYQI